MAKIELQDDLRGPMEELAARQGCSVEAALDRIIRMGISRHNALKRHAAVLKTRAEATSPAKKSPAKKSPAKKSPAKKSPAKKSPAKKSPAKKVPATKTSPVAAPDSTVS
jgi:hypothetical protein